MKREVSHVGGDDDDDDDDDQPCVKIGKTEMIENEEFFSRYVKHSVDALFRLIVPVDVRTTWHVINDVAFFTTIRKIGVLSASAPTSMINLLISVSFQQATLIETYNATANWIARELALCVFAYMLNDPTKVYSGFQPFKGYQLRISSRNKIFARNLCDDVLHRHVLQFPPSSGKDDAEFESKLNFMFGSFTTQSLLKVYKDKNYEDVLADHEVVIYRIPVSTVDTTFQDIAAYVEGQRWWMKGQGDYKMTYVSDNVYVGDADAGSKCLGEIPGVFQLMDAGLDRLATLCIKGGLSAVHFSRFEPLM